MWTHTTLLQICPLQFQRGTDFISSKSMHLYFFSSFDCRVFSPDGYHPLHAHALPAEPHHPKVPKNKTPRTMAWVQIFLHLFLSEPPMAFILWSQNKQERQKNHPCLYQPRRVTGERLGHVATSLGHAWSPFIPLPQFRSLLSL